MSDIGEALFSRLDNDADVSGVVSSRIYPSQLPQGPAYPAVTYTLVTMVEQPHGGGTDPNIVIDLYQVDCWAESYSAMIDLADKVKASLSRWRGTEATVEIVSSFHVGRRDLFEDEPRVYRRGLEFEIAWRES